MKVATCHPEKPMEARGLCANCYQRARRLGFPEVVPPVVRAPVWFCECGPSVVDDLGECSYCGRITLEAVEKSLGLR